MCSTHWQQLGAREPSQSSPGLPQPPNIPKHPDYIHTHWLLSSPTMRGSQGQRIWESFGVSQMLRICSNLPTPQSCKMVEDSEVKLFGTFFPEKQHLFQKHLNWKGKYKGTVSTPSQFPHSPVGLTPQGQILPQPPKQRSAHLSDHGHYFCRPSFHTPYIHILELMYSKFAFLLRISYSPLSRKEDKNV